VSDAVNSPVFFEARNDEKAIAEIVAEVNHRL
jgi:hypothetical protein